MLILPLLLLSGCALAAGGAVEIHGSGTTNPSKFFWKIMDLFEEESRSTIRMTYRAVGSSTGQYEFAGAGNNNVSYVDFASGDIPMTQERYNMVTQGENARTVVHIPFAVGAVGIFHSVPTADLNGSPLDLNACILARIFLRNITTWDDPAIKSLNPSLLVPPNTNIRVYHRTFGSSSTSGVTQYLQQKCPQSWTIKAGSTVEWPNSTFAVQGSDGMSDALLGNNYGIGYVDSGHGHRLNLKEIKLENEEGVFLTSKEADVGAAATAALSSGLLPSDSTASFAGVNLYAQPGPKTWPITLMSYLYLNQNLTLMGQKGQLLKTFVSYVLSNEGQTMAEEFSFVRVPPAIVAYNNATLDILVLAPGTFPYKREEESNTLKGEGAGEFVISGKRKSFGDYERGLLQNQINQLSARVRTQEAQPQLITMHGSGTTNPSKYFWKAMSLMQDRALLPLHLTYRAVGSSTGQREFVGAENSNQSFTDFGSGDIPMSAERYRYARSAGRTFVHVPFVLGAIGIFHSVPWSDLGGSPLDLDSCLLAKIFSRQITTWDDPEIKSRNPNLKVPPGQNILVAHRTFGSSSTAGATNFIAATCPQNWPLQSGSTVNWPAETIALQGSGGIASYLETTTYAISYLDSGFGHSLNLAEISLQNANGKFLTSKEANISRAAAEALKEGNIIPNDPTGDWSSVNLYNKPGDDTWPIVLFSYIYVEQDLRKLNQTGEVLKAFITFLLDTPELAVEFRFSPVPKSIYDYNMNTLSSILTSASAKPFIFEKADATRQGVGAGVFVVSGKRRSYAELERNELNKSVATLQSDVGALRTQVQQCSCNDNYKKLEDEHDDIQSLATAAIILSLIAILSVSILSAWIICKLGDGGNNSLQRKRLVSTSNVGGSAVEQKAVGMQKV